MNWIYKTELNSFDFEKAIKDQKLFFPMNYDFKKGDIIYFLVIGKDSSRIRFRAVVSKTQINEDQAFRDYQYYCLNEAAPISLEGDYMQIESIQEDFSENLSLDMLSDLGLKFSRGMVIKDIGDNHSIFEEIRTRFNTTKKAKPIKKTALDHALENLGHREAYDRTLERSAMTFVRSIEDQTLDTYLAQTKIKGFEIALGLYHDGEMSLWYDNLGHIKRPHQYFDCFKHAITKTLNGKDPIYTQILNHGFLTRSIIKHIIRKNPGFFITDPLTVARLAHHFDISISSYRDLDEFNSKLLNKVEKQAPYAFEHDTIGELEIKIIEYAHSTPVKKSFQSEINGVLKRLRDEFVPPDRPNPIKAVKLHGDDTIELCDHMLNIHHHIILLSSYEEDTHLFTYRVLSERNEYENVRAYTPDHIRDILDNAIIEPYNDHYLVVSNENDIDRVMQFHERIEKSKAPVANLYSLSFFSHEKLEEYQTRIYRYSIIQRLRPNYRNPRFIEQLAEKIGENRTVTLVQALMCIEDLLTKSGKEPYLLSYSYTYNFKWRGPEYFIDDFHVFNTYKIIPYMENLEIKKEHIAEYKEFVQKLI